MSFKLQLNGLEETIKKVTTLDNKIADEVDKEFGASANAMVKSMKAIVPVNLGRLKNGISTKRRSLMEWEIVSDAPYSAYMEFGTKGKFENVIGYEELASSAKGKGSGSFHDLYIAILEWVKKKKIVTGRVKGATKAEREQVAAWNIAISIAKNGVEATHFFTRGIEGVKPAMMRNLKKIVEG